MVVSLAATILLAVLAWRSEAGVASLLSSLGFEIPKEEAAEFRRLFLVLLGVALAVFILWKVPAVQAARAEGLSRKERAQFENTARGTLGQIVGGTVLIIGILFTWGTLQVQQQNAEIAQQNVETARRGQITERFTRAIDQLGKEQLEIRLGGIYALERIAVEAEEHHWPIMEVLTTYVREKASRKADQGAPPSSIVADYRLPSDIQAILTVIGRRNRSYGQGEAVRLNLARTDLRRADLTLANLQGANLTGAHLEGANMLTVIDLTQEQIDRAAVPRVTKKFPRLPEGLRPPQRSDAPTSPSSP